jgi:hypothetical protein
MPYTSFIYINITTEDWGIVYKRNQLHILYFSSDEGAVFSLKTTCLGNLIVTDVGYLNPHGKTVMKIAWNCN